MFFHLDPRARRSLPASSTHVTCMEGRSKSCATCSATAYDACACRTTPSFKQTVCTAHHNQLLSTTKGTMHRGGTVWGGDSCSPAASTLYFPVLSACIPHMYPAPTQTGKAHARIRELAPAHAARRPRWVISHLIHLVVQAVPRHRKLTCTMLCSCVHARL